MAVAGGSRPARQPENTKTGDKADISCVSDICVALQTDCYYNLTMIDEWDENKREVNLEKQDVDFEQVYLFDWQTVKVV